MKKLMTIIGAVVLATSAQAAAVAWSSGSNSNGFKDPTGTTLKNSAAYTMIVTFWDGTTELGTSSDTTASSLGAYTGTFSGYDFAADKTYYASAIISANDGSTRVRRTRPRSRFLATIRMRPSTSSLVLALTRLA